MPPTVLPSTEPARLPAGDTWRWTRTDPDYTPADGWALKYAFRGHDALNVTAVALVDGTGWEITVTAADSGKLTAGDYEWTRWVEKAGERYTRGAGVLVVSPNLDTALAGERVSWAQKTLTVLEQFFAGAIEDGILEHQIHGRAVKFHDPAYLEQLRNSLRREVARKRSGGRLVSLQAQMRPS